MEVKQVQRPGKVGTAMVLLYAALGAGVVRAPLEAPRTSAQGAFWVGGLVVLGIMMFFIYLIGTGRNWARITFLVLFLLGVPLSVMPLIESFAFNPLSGVLGASQMIVQGVALALLFQRPSSEWFNQMKLKR